MNAISGDISTLIFRRADRADLGEFSLDTNMLTILVELDGKKSLGTIATQTGLNLGTVKGVVLRLLRLRLIEPVGRIVSMLKKDFFEYLTAQLSLALGPIANVLIEEAVDDLALNRSAFPRKRAPELVELLAREIQREEKRLIFKQNMVNKMREIGI